MTRVLVLNAGSSTLKASIIDRPRREPVLATTLEWGDDATRTGGRAAGLRRLLESLVVEGVPLGSLAAVGHRVVHGGFRFREPVEVDDGVLTELAALSDLAPLHNPIAIDTLAAARSALPDIAHVAVFDTAFHATLDEAEARYPIPDEWSTAHGIRRFGFHGLSVAWAVQRAGELLDRPANGLGLIVAHLGSGCSVTAVTGGRSVATSMGLTPLEGLMMGTRAGSIDPGILLRLLRGGVAVDALAEGLDHESGLLAISGSTADVRALLAAEADGDARAALALEMFVRRAAAGIGAASTALERLDGLVFSGGIGEHSGAIRERIVGRLGVVGLRGPLAGAPTDAVLTTAGTAPAVLRVAAREDLVIADAAAALVEA